MADAILVFLFTVAAVFFFACRMHHAAFYPSAHVYSIRAAALRARHMHRQYLSLPRHAHVLLKRLIQAAEPLPALQQTHAHCREYSIALLRLKQNIRRLPPLPTDGYGIRMMSLCDALLQRQATPSANDLLAALHEWQATNTTTVAERAALPVVMQAALAKQLTRLLYDLLTDVRQYRHGQKLARLLMRSRKPVRAILHRRPGSVSMSAVLSVLQESQQHELLAALDDLMHEGGSSASRIREAQLHRQTSLAGQIERISACLIRFQELDWNTYSEAEDPLHRLFLNDPAGCYSRLQPASRFACRLYTARLAHRFHADEIRTARACTDAAFAAQDDAPRDHIGYYLFTSQGQQMLRRQLQSRSGWLRTFFSGNQAAAAALTAAGMTLCFGWLSLDLTQMLLPSLLFAAALFAPLYAISSRWLQYCFLLPQPVIQISSVDESLRTLIVLPAVLSEPSDAVSAVRRLLIARDACPEGAIDVLLLADYHENMTLHAAGDASIASTARAAVAAIDLPDMRALYLQRQREWDLTGRSYRGAGGKNGLLSMLNDLLNHGSCASPMDDVTVEPSELHRRYAYVLVLDEESRLLPDTLLQLIGRMEYPLVSDQCSMLMLKTASAAPGTSTSFLYRPDALMHHGDILPFSAPFSPAAQSVSGAQVSQTTSAWRSTGSPPSLHHIWQSTYALWRSAPWLRTAHRIRLCTSLIPVVSCLLMLAGSIMRQPLLLLMAFILQGVMLGMKEQAWQNVLLLPLHACLHASAAALGLYDLLRDRPYAFRQSSSVLHERRLMLLTNWSQLTVATALAGFSLITAPPEWFSLFSGLLFASFPLLHMLPAREHRTAQPDESEMQFLRDIAGDTWRYFDAMLSPEMHHLPPDSYQETPSRGASDETSPEAVAGALLALVTACDLHLITPEAAGKRIAGIIGTCASLQRWHGLFYTGYHRKTLEPSAPLYVESFSNGLLCCALLLTAQALRSYLSDLPDMQRSIPAQLDALADDMRLGDLFDEPSGCFYERLSLPERIGIGRHTCFASTALLLSFIAVMRREVPAGHLARLDRTRIRAGWRSALLSVHGSVADYALAPLLFSCPPDTQWACNIQKALQLHCRHSADHLCGLSSTLSPQTDVTLRSRLQSSGLSLLALRMPDSCTLTAPYAAALLMQWFPHQGTAALRSLSALGMQGTYGLYDGYDAHASSDSVAHAYNTFHHAVLLCACGSLLGHSPAQHFSMLPGAAAWTGLLQLPSARHPVLSPLTVRQQASALEAPPVSRAATSLCLPPDAHILGSTAASALITADGYTIMRGESLLWTRFHAAGGIQDGLRVYISNGKRSFRIGSSGHAEFHEGHAVFYETLGKLQLSLRVTVDPVAGIIWHLLDITNMAASNRTIQIGDLLLPCLQPAMNHHPHSIITESSGKHVLAASIPGSSGMLCHTLCSASHLIDVRTACDTSLLDPQLACALHAPADASPCMSFLCTAEVSGRSHISIAFATTHCHDSIPGSMMQMPTADELLSAAHMYSRLQLRSVGAGPEEAFAFFRTAPHLLWRGLPHQGAAGSLSVPQQTLCSLGIDIHMPLLLVIVRSANSMLLEECCKSIALLSVRGFPAALCILCLGNDALCSAVQQHMISLPEDLHSSIQYTVLNTETLADGVRATLEASAALILDDDRSLPQQLRALTTFLQPVKPAYPSFSGDIASPELLYPEKYGGFHPAGKAYVHLASPEDVSPAAWTRMLSDRRFGTRTSAEGLLSSYAGPMLHTTLTYHCAIPAETVYLDVNGRRLSPCLFPYGKGCMIRVQYNPGTAVWHAQADELEMQLTAASLAGYSAGLRMLRIRNRSDSVQRITLYAAAIFSPGVPDAGQYTYITSFSGMAAATAPACPLTGYLCAMEEDTHTSAMSESDFISMLALQDGGLSDPRGNNGNVALLSRCITLEPGTSATACFVIGAAHTADEIERTIEHVRTYGASASVRMMKQRLAQRLGRLTVSTPDDALNLMMNHLLPVFLHTVFPEQTPLARLCASAAMIHTSPRSMRARLLNACTHMSRSNPDRLLLPLLTDWYIRRSSDQGILDALLPETDDTQSQRDTLAKRCTDILTDIMLDTSGLPKIAGHVSRLNGLRYIASLRAFMPYLPQHLQADALRMAGLVSDAVRRTDNSGNPCLEACWEVFAGLSGSVPDHCSPADFREAAALLHALCMTEEYDQAWQLTEWLNPIKHHNAQIPPWQPERDGSAMVSAWLYIGILENLLGFMRIGNSVSMMPHLPSEWKKCSVQLQTGSATWHIDISRSCDAPQCDAIPLADGILQLTDDGRIHQARFPAK